MFLDDTNFRLHDEFCESGDVISINRNVKAKPSEPASRQIVLFTSECLVAQKHMEGIFPFLAQNGIDPVVILTPNTKSPRANIPSLQRFSFYEEGIFNDVIYPELESQKDCGRIGLSRTFNELMRAYDCEPHRIQSLKDQCVLDAIQSPKTIGALSVYHDAIFKPDLISAVKERGFFWNLHPAVLPENRGLYLAFWNMVNGVNSNGCTLHEVEEGIDTGGIVSVYETSLDSHKSVVEAYFDLPVGGAALIRRALKSYLSDGSVDAVKQAHSEQSNYYSFPTEDDISMAWEKNVRLWGTPCEMVEIYTNLFGYEPRLHNKIVDAVANIEGVDPELLRWQTTPAQAPRFAASAHRALTF